MQQGIGYVLNYHPDNATVDIRTVDGSTFPGVPLDANIAFYATPVAAVIGPDPVTGITRVLKSGSTIQFFRQADNTLRILRLFNDDTSILKNNDGITTHPADGRIQDSLLALMQSGEALMSAPGLIEIAADGKTYERIPGSWALAKNNGDFIVSNADSSAELFLSYTGDIEFTGVTYSLRGIGTSVVETAAGDLKLTASGKAPVALSLGADGTSSWTAPGVSVSLSSGTLDVTAGDIALNASTTATISAGQATISAATLNTATQDTTLYAGNSLAISSPALSTTATNSTVSVSGALNATIAGTTLNMTSSGGSIQLADSAVLSITIKGTVLRVSSSGVEIALDNTGSVCVGDPGSAVPVLTSATVVTGTAGVGHPSTYLKAVPTS